ECKLHSAKSLFECLEDGRQDINTGDAAGPEAKVSALQAAKGGYRFNGFPLERKKVLCILKENLPRPRKGEAPFRSIYQFHLEELFQIDYLFTHRRLGQREFFRGFSEAPQFNDSHESFQMVDI